MPPTLVLASTSPRRRDLLVEFGYRFIVRSAPVEESAASWLSARELVQLNARRKSLAVGAEDVPPGAVVLGADTLVSHAGLTLGKPRDLEEAAAMLARLAGRTHQVFTGVSLRSILTGRVIVFVDETRVTFLPLDEAARAGYHRLINPLDKAGAYAAQEYSERIIAAVDGSWSNVIGLPMELLSQVLEREFSLFPAPHVARDTRESH